MNRSITLFAGMALLLLVSLSCSSGGGPTAPSSSLHMADDVGCARGTQTHLWGCYDVSINISTQEVIVVPNRHIMFTANVVNFINQNPANLDFHINAVVPGLGYVDVDIDVGITHPFPGLTGYNGYDVRGVFMGNGSATLSTTGVVRPVSGSDQTMLPDPGDGFGGPDGYTRWFNRPEFSVGDMPLFSYTPGKFATPGFSGTATVCPYKYFADGLNKYADLWDWLNSHASTHGVFSAGMKNTRNYYLRFPDTTGVRYAYAIIANWEGVDQHPSNALEAVVCNVVDNSDVYYVDATTNGGNLNLDLSLFGWDGQPSTIFVESTVLSSPHELTPAEMIPVGGSEDYSTWHVEIPADDVGGLEGNEFWVIAQYGSYNYSNSFGVPNHAQNDPLAAYFRYDLEVASAPVSLPPVCDLVVVTQMPISSWDPVDVEFDASGSYDPDPGDTLSFEWDFDGDDVYDEDPDDSYTGSETNPIHTYTESYYGVVHVKVKDNHNYYSICTSDPLDVTVEGCGTMACPSGNCTTVDPAQGAAHNYVECTRAADPPRIICCNGVINRMCAMTLPGQSPPNTKIFVSGQSSQYIYNLACTSDDRLYYCHYTSRRLYYTTYNNSTGFGSMNQAFGINIPVYSWGIYKLTLDENDRPIVLAKDNYNAYQPRIYHWTGTGWGSPTVLPESIKPGSGNWRNITDLDYDPTTGYYIITVGNYPEMHYWAAGTPSIYALDSSGAVVWSDEDIWGIMSTGYLPGVEIPADDPVCHIVVMAGESSYAGDALWARYNPYGGEKATGTTGPSSTYPFSKSLCRGYHATLVEDGNTWLWWGDVYLTDMDFGYKEMPATF